MNQMSEKLISFRVDEFLRDEFKMAAAYRRKTMGEILKRQVVKFVAETMAQMENAQKKNRKGE
jgi:hypothetical protein